VCTLFTSSRRVNLERMEVHDLEGVLVFLGVGHVFHSQMHQHVTGLAIVAKHQAIVEQHEILRK